MSWQERKREEKQKYEEKSKQIKVIPKLEECQNELTMLKTEKREIEKQLKSELDLAYQNIQKLKIQLETTQKKLYEFEEPIIKAREAEQRRLMELEKAPLIARGYEDIYLKFLKGALIYKPDPNSDKGKIVLPISKLATPLEGTFDLSQSSDLDDYMSISIGYRKGNKTENIDKLEIWITPRFLVEKELQGTAKHFKTFLKTFPNATNGSGRKNTK